MLLVNETVLSLIFSEMQSVYWSLSYDPYILNAFKVVIRVHHPYKSLEVFKSYPKGIKIFKIDETILNNAYDKVMVYHVFVYDISNETREYLIKLRKFVPKSYTELLYKMFHSYRDKWDSAGTNAIRVDCYNFREYILKHELDMLIYDNYTKPYKFIIDNDIYNDKHEIEKYREYVNYRKRFRFVGEYDNAFY